MSLSLQDPTWFLTHTSRVWLCFVIRCPAGGWRRTNVDSRPNKSPLTHFPFRPGTSLGSAHCPWRYTLCPIIMQPAGGILLGPLQTQCPLQYRIQPGFQLPSTDGTIPPCFHVAIGKMGRANVICSTDEHS